MKINVSLDKQELPSPAELRQAIGLVEHLGMEDVTEALEKMLKFAERIYLQEQNAANPFEMKDPDTKKYVHRPRPGDPEARYVTDQGTAAEKRVSNRDYDTGSPFDAGEN